MSTPKTVVAGAGLAAAKAAETLREEGYDGRIVLLGSERERPYERPPLSKEYLCGEAGHENVFAQDEDFYDEHAIELPTRRGRRIDRHRGLRGRARRSRASALRPPAAGDRRPAPPPRPARRRARRRLRTAHAHRQRRPPLFAAGDVARAYHPLLEPTLRVEHWASGLDQGAAAARNTLGAQVAYERLPYFFSEQCDVGMEYSGHATERDMAPDIHALIGSGAFVDRVHLADTSVALGDLLPAAAHEA